ncbi:hypothetical protein E2C01_029659 [Portunus trituberculatus]|uniref:Uncharacterized protein n=1 Tax=Portunus trituberculatus TaxID=210409 RepID=A0A5B7ENI7_PORTR|nr:hypothetical protein [Portunus trituberculatus]
MAKGEPRTRLQRQLEAIFQQHQDVALSLSLARSRSTARRLIAAANEEEVPSPEQRRGGNAFSTIDPSSCVSVSCHTFPPTSHSSPHFALISSGLVAHLSVFRRL